MSSFTRRDLLRSTGAAAAGAVALAGTRPGDARAEAASPADDPDSNPLRLWYDRPAAEWLEALAIGNGRLGAMVFGGVAAETLMLNEDSVWAGGPHDYADPRGAEALPEIRRLLAEERWVEAQRLADERFMGRPTEQMQYQPVGDLRLAFPGLTEDVAEYRRSLDLTTAVTTTTFVAGGVRHTREVFASHADQAIVVRLRTDAPGGVSFDASFSSLQETTTLAHDGRTLALEGRSGDAEGLEGLVRFVALARAVTEGGAVVCDESSLRVRGADAVTLLVTMGTSHRSYLDVGGDPLERAAPPLERASVSGFGVLRRTHVRDHQELFGRVDLDLGTSPSADLPTDARVAAFRAGGDPQLAALYYQFGRYLLISSSRTPGQPANLQGLWNAEMLPAWQSKYTLNINCEMNYWPAGPSNLAECWQPLFAMIEELAESGARTARTMWGARGWVAHHNTDLWRGSAPVDHAFYGVWPTGGAWLSLLFWEHYEYTGDLDTLREYFPVMRGAVEFFLDTLVVDDATGYLVTSPSHSPELKHHDIDDEGVSLCAGPTMDMQILRDLFTAFDQASEELGLDRETAAAAVSAREKLPPNQIGHLGQIQEWLIDWEEAATETSRHVSHLWGVFPSDQITPRRTPELAAAADRSLELRGPAVTAGWSLAWKMNIRARLLQRDGVYKHLTQLLSPGRTAPNLFDLHPPFQIDGNFGGTSAINEMLLQSHSGEVWLLPCLPDAWPEGRVRGLRTRGGFEITMSWADHRLQQARVRSLLGRTVRLRTAGPVRVTGPGGPVTVDRPEDDLAVFETRRGATYVVHPAG
ncbi:glycoside hydrolase family 95 protein [Isoptericola sp. 4D.3]|uniref:Glycoside hydrolase family 95 protein n=1 Tax=Isoptericola peretonis TaxID=2918523 RepID=A0ABT0J0I1_9MICO|nr:glycoside hydrolase family 95 protein [Isoptericola sp. 4D.3]